MLSRDHGPARVRAGLGAALIALAGLTASPWPGVTRAAEPLTPDAAAPRSTGDRVPVTSRAERSTGTTAGVAGAAGRTSLALDAEYAVQARLEFGAARLTVDSHATITNVSDGPIDRLELNVLPAGLGRLRLDAASVDGRAASVVTTEQTLIVDLARTVAQGETFSVRVRYAASFAADLTGSNWLFSKASGIVNAYRWIPWVSRVRDFDRPNFGDPFVTPVSRAVRVTLRSDRPLAYATTGRRVSVSDDRLTQTFVANDVRDFNFTASPSYQTLTTTSVDGETRILVRARSDAAPRYARLARYFLDRFEELVGPYPYPVFTVAESAGGYAMESPALIWLPYGAPSSSIPYLLGHETAHQWFYATVGNDQPQEPFVDEAATDFLVRHVLGTRRSSYCAKARLDFSIYSYSADCYYEVVYVQGGNFIDNMRRRMGDAAFWTAMRTYYAANRFELAGTRTLLETLRRHATFDPLPSYRDRFPSYY